VRDGAGKRVMECEMCTENDKRGGAGKGSGSKGCRGAEHGQACTKNALVLWLSGQHLNRPCYSGEATKATGNPKWPTLRNVGIRYRKTIVTSRE
jgi:hypothetical protein